MLVAPAGRSSFRNRFGRARELRIGCQLVAARHQIAAGSGLCVDDAEPQTT